MLAKLRAAARARPRRTVRLRDRLRAELAAAERHRATAAAKAAARGGLGLTLIGVSTGGPRVLEEILPELPAAYPHAVVVAQHMPAGFTGAFARRLDAICEVAVSEVDRPTPLAPGHVYIGRGEADIVVERRRAPGRGSVPADGSPWHPSVDRLVRSALEVSPPAALIGVQLTGMGDDGAEAMACCTDAAAAPSPRARKRRWFLGCRANWCGGAGRRRCWPAAHPGAAGAVGGIGGWAMGLLKARGDAAAPRARRRAGKALVADLSAADPVARRAAARELGHHPDAVPALRAALGAEAEKPVQEALLAALIEIATPESAAALLALLRVKDAWLRNAALEALQEPRAADETAVRALLDDADRDMRIAALVVLPGLRCQEAEDWVVALLDREAEANVCAAAVEALDQIGGPAALPALDRLALRFAAEPFLAFAARAVRERLGGGA